MSGPAVTLDDVRAAAARVEGVATVTPLLTSRTLDERAGFSVVCKAECFQRVGAFKFRGAYSMLSALEPEQRARGVVAFSSGNHAQAVALAAQLTGAPATVVMPTDAPALKRAATEGYGARVVTYDRATEDREQIAQGLAEEHGSTIVPPYEHPLIIAGQGTVALELVEQTGGSIDTLVAPVGGGGLIAGCATVVRGLLDSVTVIGVEPEAGDDTLRSLRVGERTGIPFPETIADGLQIAIPGEITFGLNRELLDDVLLVSDAELIATMRFAFERMKIVLEPSGAAALAAVLHGKLPPGSKRVAVVLSGGNVDVGRFAELLGKVSVIPGNGGLGEA
jgi:threonine dehydratase